jgi:hypothetical protein
MPFYRFRIHGGDPRLPEDERGFYTTRHAYAVTQAKAAEKVLRRLENEFTTGVSASIWRSETPIMSIEDAWRISLLQFLTGPNRGSTLYTERG